MARTFQIIGASPRKPLMSDFLQRCSLDPETAFTTDRPQFQRRCADYYQAVADHPPRPTLLTALSYFDQEPNHSNRSTVGFAVDLGCGDGRDTAELLRHRWRVLAIDGDRDALDRLRQRQDIDRTYLETRTQRFEDLTLPPDVDLVNASFSLPFCPPSTLQTYGKNWSEP
jgi:tellurite methyltransferase